jgi:hypothetical protein
VKETDLEAFVDQSADEDRADITVAEEALANPVRIPYEQVRKQLGLQWPIAWKSQRPQNRICQHCPGRS